MTDLLAHLASVAVPLLVIPTGILLLAVRWGREGFREDYPPDIAELMPAPTAAERVRGWVLGLGFLVSLLVAIGFSTYLYLRDVGSDGGFAVAYLVTVLGMVTFSLIDTVIVDWFVICWWRPRWVVIPGTEDCEGWSDYGFHVRELLTPKGVAANLLLPIPVAAVAMWLA